MGTLQSNGSRGAPLLHRWGATATVCAALAAGGAWWMRVDGPLSAQSRERGVAAQVPASVIKPAVDLSDAFVAIATATTPAVVSIEVRVPAGMAAEGRAGPDVPEEFRQFFNLPEEGTDQPSFTGGSGFIVRADGTILTNAHVVRGADQVTVTLHDRRVLPARVVGTDPTTDVAVIKIEATDLPVLPIGDSDQVRVGQWIIAIGNPGFGGGSQLDYTVTAGIVSALGRPLQLIARDLQENPGVDTRAVSAIENFLQTDAVINPGNSGGPMIDLRGQVIGINSAIASGTGFYQGYGFAIPMNLARRVMEDLIAFGEVRRPMLGVRIETVGPEDAQYYRLPEVSGVLVQDAPAGSAAARAGLARGDVIVAIDGRTVGTVGQLQQTIASRKPGDRVTVRYYRGGAAREAAVTLGQSTIAGTAQRTDPVAAPAPEPGHGSALGIEVRDMDRELAGRFGYDAVEGAVIAGAERTGAGLRRGLRPGLRILGINGRAVADAEDVTDTLEDLRPGSIASFEVEDPAGNRRIVNVRIPE